MTQIATGILPDTALTALYQSGAIRCEAALEPDQIQPASLDVRLGFDAYRVRASFLPGYGRTVSEVLQTSGIHLHRLELNPQGTVLETGCVYLIPLQESLRLPSGIAGRANPKSSIGRLDVFTRLVTNRARAFDDIAMGYSGPLWLEVSPRTFPILVRPGDRLAQVRLRAGAMRAVGEKTLSIDLSGVFDARSGTSSGKNSGTSSSQLASGLAAESLRPGPVGWRARKHSGLIDLQALGQHNVEAFWDPLYANEGRLVLDPEAFYILASRERVKIPALKAAEMAPVALELGEFRAHYAGFFDPGFGLNPGGGRAVLEVRSRDVPYILEHGQPVAKLVFEAMQARPGQLYGGNTSHYQGQGLKLSKHFAASLNPL